MEARGAAHSHSAHSQIILTNNVFEFPFYSLTFYYFGSYLISAFAWRMFFRSAIKALRASAHRLKSRQPLLSPIAKSNRKLFAPPKLSSVFSGRARVCVGCVCVARIPSAVANTYSASLIAPAACQTGAPFILRLRPHFISRRFARPFAPTSICFRKRNDMLFQLTIRKSLKFKTFFRSLVCSVAPVAVALRLSAASVPFTIKNYRIKVIMK